MKSLRKRLNRQSGFVLSLELVVLGTLVLCAVVIGGSSFGAKLIGEFSDLGTSVGTLNQSYTMTGMAVGHPGDALCGATVHH